MSADDVHALQLSCLIIDEPDRAASDGLGAHPRQHEGAAPRSHLLGIEPQNEVLDRTVVAGLDLVVQL